MGLELPAGDEAKSEENHGIRTETSGKRSSALNMEDKHENSRR